MGWPYTLGLIVEVSHSLITLRLGRVGKEMMTKFVMTTYLFSLLLHSGEISGMVGMVSQVSLVSSIVSVSSPSPESFSITGSDSLWGAGGYVSFLRLDRGYD